MADVENRQFSLLLVDDEPAILSALKRVFRKAPYRILTAVNGPEALDMLTSTPIQAALIDLKMPEMDGLELLERIRSRWPRIKVVVLTGAGGVPEAVQAIQMGAEDFLQKPFDPEAVAARIKHIYQGWHLERERQVLRDTVHLQFGYEALIGDSPAMLKLKEAIVRVAVSDAPVLVQGETGTGKELVARAIHHHSHRAAHPFVPVDCASINETVMGSELFGHVKGAFTGAYESTKGLIRSADRGTVFLDEVGELSLAMQVKLLRALQEKEVRPVGSSRNYPIDVRILAATNRNMESEVAQGRFRQDLFFRLNVVSIGVPSLCDRVEDIPSLTKWFMQQFGTPDRSAKGISKEALCCLSNYAWPGNVRELENVICRAMVMGRDRVIRAGDLPDTIYGANTNESYSSQGVTDSMAAYELAAIRNALLKSDGHRKKAARLLGIGEATLYRKLNKYGIE